MTYPLDSFSPEFWEKFNEPGVRFAGAKPVTVEQALWEIDIDSWTNMVRKLFDLHPQDVGIDDVITIIKKTNTCSNLDSPVEVWIDKKGDFKIKVYNVR